MRTVRVIPCLDVDAGRVVKGVRFTDLFDAGDPVELAARYDAQGADELVFLDITASSDNRSTMVDVVARTAEQVFIPFTVGGGVRAVEDARRLLAEAGYPGGRGLPPVQILYNTNEGHKQIAEVIQQMWKTRLGVEAELVNEEWKVYLQTARSGNYQIARAGWIASYSDPLPFLDIWETGNGENETGWSNAEYDRLLHQSMAARSEAERYGYYRKMDAILVDECPVIPIYFYTRAYLLSQRVTGFWPNFLDHHPYKAIDLIR